MSNYAAKSKQGRFVRKKPGLFKVKPVGFQKMDTPRSRLWTRGDETEMRGLTSTVGGVGEWRPGPGACFGERGHSCPVPPGLERGALPVDCGEGPVPEGHVAIAQRFNVGSDRPETYESRRDG